MGHAPHLCGSCPIFVDHEPSGVVQRARGPDPSAADAGRTSRPRRAQVPRVPGHAPGRPRRTRTHLRFGDDEHHARRLRVGEPAGPLPRPGVNVQPVERCGRDQPGVRRPPGRHMHRGDCSGIPVSRRPAGSVPSADARTPAAARGDTHVASRPPAGIHDGAQSAHVTLLIIARSVGDHWFKIRICRGRFIRADATKAQY